MQESSPNGNVDLIRLYDVFGYLRATLGDLSNIKHREGNEEKISEIIDKVKDYLASRHLIVDNRAELNVDVICNSELESIFTLFIVNTEFNSIDSILGIREFAHFIEAIPSISKCVLVNIIVAISVKQCCPLLSRLPCVIGKEIFEEFLIYSKRCTPPELLLESVHISSTIMTMLKDLDATNQQNMDTIDKLEDIASEILQNISCIKGTWRENMTASEFDTHLGYAFFFVIRLYNWCLPDMNKLNKLMQTLAEAYERILLIVTNEMIATWKKVIYKYPVLLESVLYTELSTVNANLAEYEDTAQLMEQVNTTFTNLIDFEIAMANIDNADENPQKLIRYLINPSLFANERAMNYLDRWAHLCTKDDVIRLLILTVSHTDRQVKALVHKCVRVLNVQELQRVLTEYFCKCDVDSLTASSVKKDLKSLMNNTDIDAEVDDEFIKSLYLLLVQNPKAALYTLFYKCLKTDSYAIYFKRAFYYLKIPLEQMQELAKNVFVQVFKRSPPNEKSIIRHKNLLDILMELNYFNMHSVFNEIFKPRLEEFLSDIDNYEIVHVLQLLNIIFVEYALHEDILEVISVLSKILEATRCNKENFTIVRQNIVEEVLNILSKYSSSAAIQQENMKYKDFLDNLEITNPMNRYYITELYQNMDGKFLEYVWPQNRTTSPVDDLRMLLKILPSCVGSEWILVIKELDSRHDDYGFLLSEFEAILIYLCEEVTKSTNSFNVDRLKYYLEHFAIAANDVLKPKYKSRNAERVLIETMCNILKEIPENMKETDGLHLINLLSIDALRSLKRDREFILLLISIKHLGITEIFEEKMLTSR